MKLFEVYPLYDIELERGEGSYVYDKNGVRYLDFYGGHAVISIGHGHQHYVKTLTEQLNKLAFYSNSVKIPIQERLAKKLGELSQMPDYQLFLCNSGAEANENALKLASFRNGRTKVIAFKKGFHGRTSAAVNTTDDVKIQAPINQTFVTELHDLNNLETVKKSIENNDVCAVIIEGIQGVGGIHVANVAFLEAVAALCKAHNTALIMDEVQSGYGRSGKFFAFQYANIQPDLVTMAKGMGNGFPIGGVLIHPSFEAKFGLLGTTFGGNHLACAAGLAVLEVIENEQLIENISELSTYLIEQLHTIKGVTEIRGLGLMIGVSFDFPVATLRKNLVFQEKVFVGSSSDPNTIRLLPPLNITKKKIDILIKALEFGF